MTAIRISLALLLLAFAVAAGAVHAQSGTLAPSTPAIPSGQNGMDTSFARLDTPPRVLYDGPGTPIEARFTIKKASDAQACHIIMVGFNALSASVSVVLDDLVTDGGAPVRIVQDNRTDSLQQPKVWIDPSDVPLGEELVLQGRVTVEGNGQFHVGAIVIAFDEQYQKFVTPRNEIAEVYAYALVGAVDAAGPGAAPFEGQGNVPGFGPGLALAACLLPVALRRRA